MAFITSNVVHTSADGVDLIPGDNLYIAPGVTVAGGSDGSSFSGAVSTGGVMAVQIEGTLFGNDYGLEIADGANVIQIGPEGSVIANSQSAVYCGSGGDIITNNGVIQGSLYTQTGGIVVHGSGDSTVFNNGSVSGNTAIFLEAGDNAIVNTGTITGDAFGIVLDTAAGTTSTIDNSGTVAVNTLADSNTDAILDTGSGTLKITNQGHIAGDITFGPGKDWLDSTLGTIDGTVFGAAGNDMLKGGAASDRLDGGAGGDKLYGGGGGDTFIYAAASESTGRGHDTIFALDAQRDSIDLNIHVTAIRHKISGGALDGNVHFNAELAAAVGPSQLGKHQAVLFEPNSGSLAGHVLLVVDANGTAGYQAGADYVIELSHAANLAHLTIGLFI